MPFDPFNPTFMKGGPGGPMPMGGHMGGFPRPMMPGPGGSFRGDNRRGPDPRMMGPNVHQQMGRAGSMKGAPKVISLGRSFGADVKLKQADNAWKPSSLKDKPNDADQEKTDKLYKAVRGILNKLTPQKFSVLVKQVLDLNIDSEERLQGCINIIWYGRGSSFPAFTRDIFRILLAFWQLQGREWEKVAHMGDLTRGSVKIDNHLSYLIFVIFFTRARFLETTFYTQKRVNIDKTDFATK